MNKVILLKVSFAFFLNSKYNISRYLSKKRCRNYVDANEVGSPNSSDVNAATYIMGWKYMLGQNYCLTTAKVAAAEEEEGEKG